MSPIQILDRHAVNELKGLSTGNSENFFLDQVLLFAERVREQLPRLDTAARDHDIVTLRSLAHALGGSAAAIGAMRLSELSLDLEDRAEAMDLHQLRPAVTAIKLAFLDSERELAIAASDVYIAFERIVAT